MERRLLLFGNSKTYGKNIEYNIINYMAYIRDYIFVLFYYLIMNHVHIQFFKQDAEKLV